MTISTQAPDSSAGADAARSDVQALIEAYRRLFAVACERRVRRLRVRRLAIGLDRFLIERMRLVTDTLSRAYALRASAGSTIEPSEKDDRERLREFTASLPPSVSRARQFWVVIPIFILAKIILTWFVTRILDAFHQVDYSGQEVPKVREDELSSALRSLGSIDIASATNSVDLLFGQSFLVSICVVFSLCLGAYLVLRPFASGLALSRALLATIDSDLRDNHDSAVDHVDEPSCIRNREQRAFSHLGLEPPGESRSDLLIRCLLPVGLLAAGIGIWKATVEGVVTDQFTQGGGDPFLATSAVTTIKQPEILLITAFTLAIVGAAQLGWLTFRLTQRRSPSTLLAAHAPFVRPRSERELRAAPWTCAVGAVIVAAVTFAGYKALVRKQPSVTVNLSSPISVAMVDEGEFSVDLFCDAPCHLRGVYLLDARFPPHFATTKGARIDTFLVNASPAIRDGGQWRQHVRLAFERQQSVWLRARLLSHAGAGLLFDVAPGAQTCYSDCPRQVLTQVIFRDEF